MEFVNGKQLSALTSEGKLTIEQKILISIDISNAVKLLHDKDILHRDIKADNILIDINFQPKVVDYGVSKIAGNPTITPTSKFLGTLRFASPQAINGDRVDKADDIYSLGAVLFELFTKKELFGEVENKALLVDAIVMHPVNQAARLRVAC
jgi:serine/threonine protein kinase